MNINLNLATRPYIELRSVYARLRVFAVILAALSLPMLLVVHVEETKAQLAEARVSQLEANIALLQQQQRNARALATQGANAAVLNQAAFLNDLFRRKAFSWTATMSDLENTLPYGVQVAAIDPVIAPDGHVTIRMRITGSRERAVEVVHNLERSRHFLAPRLVSEAIADQSNGQGNSGQVRQVSAAAGGSANDVSFDIQADYRPLPNSHDHATIAAAAGRRERAAEVTPGPTPAATPARTAVPPAPAGAAVLTNPDPATARPAFPQNHPHEARPFGRPLPGTPAAMGPSGVPGGVPSGGPD